MTSINFRPKDYQEIFENMIRESSEYNLISYDQNFFEHIKSRYDISSMYVLFFSVISESLADVYIEEKNVYDGYNTDLAVGRDLDNLGRLKGISRPEDTAPFTDLIFKLDREDNQDVIIPEGLEISTNDKSIIYKVAKEGCISLGDTEIVVPSYCIIKGLSGRLADNELTKILGDIDTNVNISVVNPYSSSGGSEGFTDEEYREYLDNWLGIHQRGNEWAYKYYFSNLDGVDGFRLVPLWNGSGTILIIIDPDSEYLKNKIHNDIKSNVGLFDDDITIRGAKKKDIEIYSIANVDIDMLTPYSSPEKSEISLRIENAIKLYIDGGYRRDGSFYKGLTIGEDFIPHKCSVFIDKEIPELKTIKFTYPEEYIVIADDEIATSEKIKAVIN
jgi:uncharacterized phage protein gp47/JayE